MAVSFLRNPFKPKTKTYRSNFRSSLGQTQSFEYDFNPAWFKVDPYQFSLDLARISLAKAMATYNAPLGYIKGDQYIKEFHQKLGFKNIESNHYYTSKPETNGIGVQLATRKIWVGLRRVTILSIAVRSGGYESEWYSNMVFGDQGNHQGFEEAAIRVITDLNSYLVLKGLNKVKHLKIWISGYSRGAATSNLVSAEILRQLHKEKEPIIHGYQLKFHPRAKIEVYSYNIECPLNAVFEEEKPYHHCIYNLNSQSDIVTHLPFAFMGFKRYGVDMPLAIKNEGKDILSALLPNYKRHGFAIKVVSKKSLIDAKTQLSKIEFIEDLLEFLQIDARFTRQKYVENYQVGVASFAKLLKTISKHEKQAILSKISLPLLFASLLTFLTFKKYIYSLLKSINYQPSEESDMALHSLFVLIKDLLKSDEEYGYAHIATVLSSSKSLFEEHQIERIYAYLKSCSFPLIAIEKED